MGVLMSGKDGSVWDRCFAEMLMLTAWLRCVE